MRELLVDILGVVLDDDKTESGDSVKWLGVVHSMSDPDSTAADADQEPQKYTLDIGELRKTKLIKTLDTHISSGRMSQ